MTLVELSDFRPPPRGPQTARPSRRVRASARTQASCDGGRIRYGAELGGGRVLRVSAFLAGGGRVIPLWVAWLGLAIGVVFGGAFVAVWMGAGG